MFQSFGRGVSGLIYDGRFGRSGRGLISGVLAFTGVCAGAAYFRGFCKEDTAILLSLSPPLRGSIYQSWETLQQFPLLVLQNRFPTSGYFPSWFSMRGSTSTDFSAREGTRRYDSIPLSKDLNDASRTESGGGSCSNGCLGGDCIAKAAAKVCPAVDNVFGTQDFIIYHSGFNAGPIGRLGSGTIIDPDGTILTCAHIVAKFQSGKDQLKGKVIVALQDGRNFDAVVLHADLHSDIAVIKLNSSGPFPVAKLGSSANLRPGEWVLALGYPIPSQNTVTAGIISCVDRKGTDLGLSVLERGYLKTDCAINEGYSGGPLINLNGEVIGVNIVTGMFADGESFVVPMEVVSTVIEQLRKNERVIRPWIGAIMTDLDDMVTAQLKEKNPAFPSASKGTLIDRVIAGSPAEQAGLRPGDIVIELGGVSIKNEEEFTRIMVNQVGKPLKILVKRANNETVLLEVVPEEANPPSQ